MKKQEILEKCREILYTAAINNPIGEEDFKFMINLFRLHPKWLEKCNGKKVKAIIVRRNQQYQNKLFALVLEDDTITDISFLEAVNRKGLKEDIKLACSEIVKDIEKPNIDLGNVVKEWLKNFDNEELTIGIYLVDKHFENQALINNFRNFYGQIN